MRRRSVMVGLVALLPILAACGGSELTVVVLAGEGDEQQPVADLPIELLPFNRDSVFEALAARAEEAEPQIPADLQAQFDLMGDLRIEVQIEVVVEIPAGSRNKYEYDEGSHRPQSITHSTPRQRRRPDHPLAVSRAIGPSPARGIPGDRAITRSRCAGGP